MSQGWSQDQQLVKQESEEQREPEALASRPRQAREASEAPAKSSCKNSLTLPRTGARSGCG